MMVRSVRGPGSVLEAASVGVHRKPVATATDEMDDQPDDPDQNQQWNKWNEQPDVARQDSAVAAYCGAGCEIRLAGCDGDVSAYLRPLGQIEVAAEDRIVSGDPVPGVHADASEGNRYVTGHIAVNSDRAKGAGDVPCRLAFGYGDVGAHAGAVVTAFGEGGQRGSGEKEQSGGEECVAHGTPRG